MKNLYYSTTTGSYSEPKALQQLLDNANEALAAECEALENNTDAELDFTITINGVQTAFYCGGPQIEALFRFVQHIADENLYEVDFKEMKVISHLL